MPDIKTLRAAVARVSSGALEAAPDMLTFSHLRWDFVFQRPQHLMARFAKARRVFFFEEPIVHDQPSAPRLEIRICKETGVRVVVPHLGGPLSRFATEAAQKELLDRFCQDNAVKRPIAWYYTPALYCYSKHLDAVAVVYDCMDELANFRFASPQLPLLERELMRRADVVFTGGQSLYEAKRALHPQVYCFPSSVDRAHFSAARNRKLPEPPDQKDLARPRLGFYGVIDERMDFGLIHAVAQARPDWSIVLLGPLAKVSPDELPRRPNIHYLGAKPYQELPRYLAGWDVALMPFAINEATRFISPTKTPEYLAGGKPVVSSPITDVVRQFGKLKGVGIAETPGTFVTRCEEALALKTDRMWLPEADASLANQSWDRTFARMNAIIEEAANRRDPARRIAPATFRTEAREPALRLES